MYWANGKHHGGKPGVMLEERLTEQGHVVSIVQILAYTSETGVVRVSGELRLQGDRGGGGQGG